MSDETPKGLGFWQRILLDAIRKNPVTLNEILPVNPTASQRRSLCRSAYLLESRGLVEISKSGRYLVIARVDGNPE